MEPSSNNVLANPFLAWMTSVLICWILPSPAASSEASVGTAHPPKPKSLGFPPNLALGDDAIASCFVPRAKWHGEGLRMTWTRQNGENLGANRRVSLFSSSESSVTLSIRDVRPEDVGNYTCVASYGATSERVTVALTVSGEPFSSLRLSVL
ncbi:hypothetical protein V5799_008409 [Amblyomma americanum]|uniref:Ig-like domain-containing protein n=1 Tax=Amblyomma americanum TaxID=6943 RepID=A0AAQ4FE48_AMBAM